MAKLPPWAVAVRAAATRTCTQGVVIRSTAEASTTTLDELAIASLVCSLSRIAATRSRLDSSGRTTPAFGLDCFLGMTLKL